MIIHKGFGLDLGTTNSTAAIVQDGKIIFAEENKARNKTIPSIIALRRNGTEVCGTVAKNEFYAGNEDSKKSIKREMGKQVTFPIGKNIYTPEEISAKIINFCKSCLENTIIKDSDVVYDNIVITVPAYFTLAQKDATRKAGEFAGLNVQMLLEEPTAAAINFAVQNNIDNGLFLVFDLGGGTFDVSILEKIESIPSVLATAGNNFLGGDNFDYILARYFKDYLDDAGYDVSDIDVDANNTKFRLLMFAAENVKKRLSMEETIEINIPDVFKDNSGVEIVIDEFTREQFNELIKDKVEIDIIKECDKALNILKEKYDKDINDVTHILLVGGSTKIPYVQDVIRNKYCHTSKLKDVTIFDPNNSVSAGAAFVASSNGFKIEDPKKGILVQINAPYVIGDQVVVSGNVEKGNVSKVGLESKTGEIRTTLAQDGSFSFTISSSEYMDSNKYKFYDSVGVVNEAKNDDKSTVDIIAPMPVQNETIAVEIIDVEKGVTEKYPIVNSGEYLPCESTETFKINEYSQEQIKLPIWEGHRHIFNLIIDLPDNVRIGSKVDITTQVDMVSNITLNVSMNGVKLEGRYEKISTDGDDTSVDDLNDLFEERIDYIDDIEEKEELINRKDDIYRELEEASSNNDINHYSTVAQGFEKMVAEMPVARALENSDFDEIGDYIKDRLTSDINITDFEVDNLVFYGKRFLKKNNIQEAQNSMNELEQMKHAIDLLNSPSSLYKTAKATAAQALLFADEYRKDRNANPSYVNQLNRELENNMEEIVEVFGKWDEDADDPRMKDDAMKLIALTRGIFEIMMKVKPADDKTVSMYKGLVSKA